MANCERRVLSIVRLPRLGIVPLTIGSKEVRSGGERREIGFERFFPHKKKLLFYIFNSLPSDIVLFKALRV